MDRSLSGIGGFTTAAIRDDAKRQRTAFGAWRCWRPQRDKSNSLPRFPGANISCFLLIPIDFYLFLLIPTDFHAIIWQWTGEPGR
jgi:hypothetical protein